MNNFLTIITPDDWHLHLRDNAMLMSVLPHTIAQFKRAIIMPNLNPPITTTDQAIAYRNRILAALPAHSTFEPLMVLYLTHNTSVQEILKAKNSNFIHAVKLYPAGATTHSNNGITDVRKCYKSLNILQEIGMPLLIHGEMIEENIDIFDREAAFIEHVIEPLQRDMPALKIVLEHITTKDAVDYITTHKGKIAATITAHHLLYNRNKIFQNGINPHYYCLPILKREKHRQALINAAISKNGKFFLGTDSAPHSKFSKECASGCAGCYTALHALELYAEIFDNAKAQDRLEAFASFNGPDFYGLPRNRSTITLRRENWIVPIELSMGNTKVIPFNSGETMHWKIY